LSDLEKQYMKYRFDRNVRQSGSKVKKIKKIKKIKKM